MLQMKFRQIITVLAPVAALALMGTAAQARPKYAKAENVGCDHCHVTPGGPRNFRGMYYGANDHSFAKFDEEFEAKMAGVKPKSMAGDAKPTSSTYPNYSVPAPLRFTLKDIDGKPVNLGRYAGKVIMMVNVASFCGNTPQYAGLQKLYDKYKDKGFVVLGFPANEFGKQEPGSEKEIKEFCTSKYNVTFPMFSKIVVKGEGQDPLYKFLTNKETDPKFGKDIEWNFAKFIINRKGEIVDRVSAMKDVTKSPDVVAEIEKELNADK
jgi:glutathione peroxidase